MAPLRSLIPILGALAVMQPSVGAEDTQQIPLAASHDYECHHPPYQIHMISKSPLVIYISNFITDSERSHLQNTSHDSFTRSHVASRSGASKHSVRTSQSTLVPRDPIVRCIETRALAFQGYDTPRQNLEPLQLVKYGPTERYHYHTDWFTDPGHATASVGGNRVSSFFAYVHVANDTTGGGTNFAHLDPPMDPRWCDMGYIDCDSEYDRGVTFRPVEGNAIYWENLLPNGRGDERTLHAGLPLTGGGKIGMNIWTREMALPEEVRGKDYYP